jgi:hypothetical protein
MLGSGAVTADAELDDLVDLIEAQVCHMNFVTWLTLLQVAGLDSHALPTLSARDARPDARPVDCPFVWQHALIFVHTSNLPSPPINNTHTPCCTADAVQAAAAGPLWRAHAHITLHLLFT